MRCVTFFLSSLFFLGGGGGVIRTPSLSQAVSICGPLSTDFVAIAFFFFVWLSYHYFIYSLLCVFIFFFVLCFTIALHFLSSCYFFFVVCIFIIKSESTKIVGLKLTLDKSKVGKEKGLFFPSLKGKLASFLPTSRLVCAIDEHFVVLPADAIPIDNRFFVFFFFVDSR